jgi:NAD(P)-dependent dehydrogenase (short-subunit alcohol dehydrogenase family)
LPFSRPPLPQLTRKGIGQYTAYALARQGVRAFSLIDRNALTTTAAELKKLAPDASILELPLDVTNETAVTDSVSQTVKQFGRLDYAVNNAGIGGTIAPSSQIALSEFQHILAVNTTAVWQCQRAQIRQMLSQSPRSDSYRANRGAIVNVASMFGVVAPAPDVPTTAYSTSKHAVLGLTKADALAFANKGIRINAVSPGYVLTPLVKEHMSQDGIMERERGKVPVGRYAEMEEIGDCIAFLCSDAASYMVGANLVVDGGFTVG